MINKKSLWFLTLFSLILVLSIYYITMPSDLLLSSNLKNMNEDSIKENTDNDNNKDNGKVNKIEESEILVALRVESDEQLEEELDSLKTVLTSSESTTDQKNTAFEKMKELNNKRTEEKSLESKILDTYSLKAFVKISGDQIRVIVDSKTHDVTMANNIMNLIQKEYKENKYITVKFQSN